MQLLGATHQNKSTNLWKRELKKLEDVTKAAKKIESFFAMGYSFTQVVTWLTYPRTRFCNVL